MAERDSALRASWDDNAEAWTAAVREQRIESRRVATDAAIVQACERACARATTARVLDVGCGEGWLARALAARGADVLGIDASAALVDAAVAEGGGPRYAVIAYEDLIGSPHLAAGPWDVVVCNFSLLAERLAPLLGALRSRLAPGGALLIQTVHPWAVAAAEPPYADGWRTETFARIAGPWRATMPWYFRTFGSWMAELRAAGLTVAAVAEPASPASGMPVSLVIECRSQS